MILVGLQACGVRPSPLPTTLAQECFRADAIDGFFDAKGSTVRVSPSAGREYTLTLLGPGCDDIGWAEAISVNFSGSPVVCTGAANDATQIQFSDRSNGREVRCILARVVKASSRFGRP